MSSTEPPSRSQRGQSHETKAAREHLENKGYVEKVREVDPDEQTRKERFAKFYNKEPVEEEVEKPTHPSPFELYSKKPPVSENLSNKFQDSDLEDVANSAIPSPEYSAPPNVEDARASDDEDFNEDALPQSDGFWSGRDDADFPPEKNPLPIEMYEGSPPQNRSSNQVKKGTKTPEKSGKTSKIKPKEIPVSMGMVEKPLDQKVSKNKKEEKKLPSPFDAISNTKKGVEDKEPPLKFNENKPLKKTKDDGSSNIDPLVAPHKQEEKHDGGGSQSHDRSTIFVEQANTSQFPQNITTIATGATQAASPYLSETTANLFFHMVGTMQMMTGPQGVNRTEIVLNNPSFAGSKFFGATIRIEKYATAPDSFNITLSGSNEAVVSFKENMPSLMEAFQNGNFSFKVNRLDAEYGVEKHLIRRKERDEGKDKDTGGEE